MAKCSRCGASNEWVSGGRPPRDCAAEVENNELRGTFDRLRAHVEDLKRGFQDLEAGTAREDRCRDFEAKLDRLRALLS